MAKRIKTKLIGYVRVSTDKQAETGISLKAQKAKLKQYASLYDIDLIRIEVDTGTGKNLARKGLMRALGAISNGEAEGLVVYKLDRLTRSVSDLSELIENHFIDSALLSVSEQIDTRSAGGRLVLNVLASVSQWEREAISERTSTALRYKKDQGVHLGGIPYGFKLVDQHLEKDKEEQGIIRRIKRLRKSGLSLRKVVDKLEESEITTRKGTPFSLTQVARILK